MCIKRLYIYKETNSDRYIEGVGVGGGGETPDSQSDRDRERGSFIVYVRFALVFIL